MISTQFLLLILLIVAVAGVLIWRSYRVKRAGNRASDILPVWAAQGPFGSGEQSAVAMRNAYRAVRGAAKAVQMAEAITRHARAYDKDPATWEKLRLETGQGISSETEKYVAIAKGFAATDSMNKDSLKGRGQGLGLAVPSDELFPNAFKQTLSDEEFAKEKEDYEATLSGIGQRLLDDPSDEAMALLAFMCEVYEANSGVAPASATDIGKAYWACLEINKKEPGSELAKEFKRLTDALDPPDHQFK